MCLPQRPMAITIVKRSAILGFFFLYIIYLYFWDILRFVVFKALLKICRYLVLCCFYEIFDFIILIVIFHPIIVLKIKLYRSGQYPVLKNETY